jgi:predicted aspartyl protease
MRQAVIVVATVAPLVVSSAQTPPTSATVPLDASTNTAIVELTFQKKDGTPRTARFVIDTGGGAFILSEALANDIGIERTGPAQKGEEGTFAPLATPAVRLGDMPMDLQGVPAVAQIGLARLNARDDADGLVPGRLLRKYHVIFDYPAKTFTMARPGTVTPRGERLPAPIGRTGFPRIELTITGETQGFLLDTGATYTMISRAALDRWAAAEAAWPRAIGAVGMANMFGGKLEAEALMLRMPQVMLGTLRIDHAAAVSRPIGTFEKFMSSLMTSPIVGAIGGNILKQFRVEIDYASGVVYLQRGGTSEPNDLDQVGLTLAATPSGALMISAVSAGNDPAVVQAVRAGDRLLRVDGVEMTGVTLSAAQKALAGRPGETKTIVVERGGAPITVQATVSRIL